MKYFLVIMQIIPALINVIKAIEAAIPGTGKGEEKLAAVRQIIEVTYSEAAAVWPMIQGVIAVLVNLFNKTDAFKIVDPAPVFPVLPEG